MTLYIVIALLAICVTLVKAAQDSFYESLTLHPLPDGKISVLFECTTYFSLSFSARSVPSHHSLTSPSLLLPLAQQNVSELSISFVSGQWDQQRTGQSGPLHYSSSGGGGEIRGWLRDIGDDKAMDERWLAVTNALGGLFCAGLQPEHEGDVVRTFGDIYLPSRESRFNLTHFHLPHPEQHLCTENLTPFLALLPSKGVSGLSHLLAQPGVVLSWGFKAEGIDVLMPDPSTGAGGRWRGWWEGVVDAIPVTGGSRQSGIRQLFRRDLPRVFPEAEGSVVRLIMPEDDGFRVEPDSYRTDRRWMDGRSRNVAEWDLTQGSLTGRNIRWWWENEGDFKHPITIEPPTITVSRRMAAPYGSEGTFVIRITNNGGENRSATYSEVWPWWVKGWMSEMTLSVEGAVESRGDLLHHLAYHPSRPPHPSTTSLHFTLTLPAHSTLILSIPYSKLTIKYTEHRPDAERGVELPSGVLTLLDLEGESESADQVHMDELQPRKSGRKHIYTTRLLLDLPTPDFSMPYNVIIMSSTVMAVFFGLMQGSLTRRWGFVEVLPEERVEEVNGKVASPSGEVLEKEQQNLSGDLVYAEGKGDFADRAGGIFLDLCKDFSGRAGGDNGH